MRRRLYIFGEIYQSNWHKATRFKSVQNAHMGCDIAITCGSHQVNWKSHVHVSTTRITCFGYQKQVRLLYYHAAYIEKFLNTRHVA
jgi:hypothetical protein